MLSRIEVLAVVGLTLIGLSIYLWFGVAAVLAYIGAVILTACVLIEQTRLYDERRRGE